MFTGIITDKAAVRRTKPTGDGLVVTFARPSGWKDMTVGESVATDGACLTVTDIRDDEYDCFLMPETLSKTTFGKRIPKFVNLERPLSVGDRLGGHFVQGHVDCVGKVTKVENTDDWRLFVELPRVNKSYVIPKGSITINGVSLTVASIDGHTLGVALIPHTLEATTLKSLLVGDLVNLEFDMVGKYIVNVTKQGYQHAKS